MTEVRVTASSQVIEMMIEADGRSVIVGLDASQAEKIAALLHKGAQVLRAARASKSAEQANH